MPPLLKIHNMILESEGYYKDTRPYLWDEFAIDTPDVDANGNVIWCPLKYVADERIND